MPKAPSATNRNTPVCMQAYNGVHQEPSTVLSFTPCNRPASQTYLSKLLPSFKINRGGN